MIEARNLGIKRGRKTIIKTIDFQAKSGEITIIAGPNGSGKTTLLNALSQDIAYQGDIFINGFDIKTLKPWQKAQIRGVLPQASSISFPFLVHEIVEFGVLAGNAGLDLLNDFSQEKTPFFYPDTHKNRNLDIAERALIRVDLAGYGNRFYQELSGGEQARVQMARVLSQIWHARYHNMACWLLLDEPVSSLDIKHQSIVMDIARDFAAQGGGVIAVLHDLNLAAAYADQLILMKQGTLIHQGTPKTIMTSDNLRYIYECRVEVNKTPENNLPFLLPQTVSQPFHKSREHPS